MKVNKIMGLVALTLCVSLPISAVNFTEALNKVDGVVSTIPQFQSPLSELIQTAPATKNQIETSIQTIQNQINTIKAQVNNKQADMVIGSIPALLTQLTMITNMVLKLVMKVDALLVPTARIVGIFDANAMNRINRVNTDTNIVIMQLMSSLPQITNQINSILMQIASITKQITVAAGQ